MPSLTEANRRTDRFLYYNYALKFKNCAEVKYIFREEMIKNYGLTNGSIAKLINDYKVDGFTSPKRHKWKDYTIRAIHEKRGCLIDEKITVKKVVDVKKNSKKIMLF